MDFDCDDFEKTLKVIVVGNGNVGKTSMTTRYAKGKYTGTYKKTIGVDFMEKTVELRDLGESINLMIWDTAGQEEFDALTSRYYKGAGAVIYVFSTVDRESFEDLPKWKRKVEEECGHICSVLVQNKIDLADDAAVSREEVEDMADYLNMRFYRSCVQDNVNVSEVFRYLCRKFLKSDTAGDGDEMLNAVADISSLSKSTPVSGGSHSSSGTKDRCGAASSRRTKREPSDISDSESESTSATPTPTSKTKSFSPSPPAKLDAGTEDFSDQESDEDMAGNRRRGYGGAHKDKEREYRGDREPRKNRDTDKSSSKRADRESRPIKETDESLQHRSSTDHESEAKAEEALVDSVDGRTSSEEAGPSTLKPSKRRTNGKKRHPPPECVIS